MNFKNIKLVSISLILTVIILVSPVATAAPALDSIHYVVNGDTSEINALKLKLNYHIDSINSFNPKFTYHEQEFKLKGTWKINFLQNYRQLSNINLNLSMATPLKEISPEPAIGLSGNLDYMEHNKINLKLDYYFDKSVNNMVYHGGISLPLSTRGKLTLGLGNSIWYINQTIFDLGLKVDL